MIDNDDALDAALREIAARERRGRPPKRTFALEYVRDATPEDVEAVNEAPTKLLPVPHTQVLRHRHHELARLLAHGTSNVEAAAQTGYTPARIQQLRADPSFEELLAHYALLRDAEFVDAQKQLATLGRTAAGILLDKLEADGLEAPYASTIEIMKSAMDRSEAPSKAGGGARSINESGAPAVQLNVSFVAPPERPTALIDITPQRSEDDN